MRAAIRVGLAAVLAWGVGAAAAVALGVLAASGVRAALAHPAKQSEAPEPVRPVTPEEMNDEGISSAVTVEPTRPRSTATEHIVGSAGGTVLVQCSAAGAYLASVSPAQGYRAKEVKREPAPEAKVVFESEERKVEVLVRCTAGVPQTRIKVEENTLRTTEQNHLSTTGRPSDR